MNLKINKEKLDDILKAFYTLVKIKIVVFDSEHNVITAYPVKDCHFCEMMKSNEETRKLCKVSDYNSFDICRKTGKLMLYTCYAGLVEACAPLKYNGVIIGYIMFGQISDLPSKPTLIQNIKDVCKQYGLDSRSFLKYADSIKLKSHDSIFAAAKIMEACISYILLNEMLIPQKDGIVEKCCIYINENADSVTVEALCAYMKISRTSLYSMFKEKLGIGVSGYIRETRLEKAKAMLTETDLTIAEIAEKCGFADYNYFSRIFKKKYGISPRNI